MYRDYLWSQTFRGSNLSYYFIWTANNKGAYQPVQSHRLNSTFVVFVVKWLNQVFLWYGSFYFQCTFKSSVNFLGAYLASGIGPDF